MLNELFFGVEVFDDSIGIGLVTGCKYHELKLFGQLSEYFPSKWSNINGSKHLIVSWKSNRYFYLMGLGQFLKTMHQCLVKIEYNTDFIYISYTILL